MTSQNEKAYSLRTKSDTKYIRQKFITKLRGYRYIFVLHDENCATQVFRLLKREIQ